MTTRRFARRPRRFRSFPRRRTAWTTQEYRPVVITPGGVNRLNLTPVTGDVETSAGGAALPQGMAREGLSLARTLIDMAIFVPDVDGNPHNATLWYGLITAAEDAFALNAVPSPGEDDGDWLWLGCKDVAHRSSIASGFDPMSFARVEIDTRVSRRMDSSREFLIFTVRNDNQSLDNVQIRACIRNLWRLP